MKDQNLPLTEWRNGKPPSVGLWIASRCRNSATKRWFDGSFFSVPVLDGVGQGAPQSLKRAKEQGEIKYRGLVDPHPEGYTYELTPTEGA